LVNSRCRFSAYAPAIIACLLTGAGSSADPNNQY
jgi:hypothetical protein